VLSECRRVAALDRVGTSEVAWVVLACGVNLKQ